MATYRANSQIVAATAANGTMPKPTGTVAGDTIGIFYSLENDIPIVPPNGFIITTNQDHAGAAHDQFFMWKRAGGSEAASYVVTHASTWRSGFIVAVQNTSATRDPHGGAANQGASTTATALAATADGANAYALATYTTFADMTGTGGGQNMVPTSGWTERWDSANNIYAQDKALASAGSAGDAAVSFLASQQWMARQLIFEDVSLVSTDPTVVQVKHNVITASRSPAVTFDFAPLENDIVVFWPSSTVVGATLTIPAGWVNILSGTTDVESDSHQFCGVYHRVTSVEAAANTVTFTATNLYGATVTGNVMAAVIRNVDTTTAVDVTSSTLDSGNAVTPHVLPGLTPTVSNGLFMSAVAADEASIYCVPPSGFDIATINTNTGKVVAWRETLTSAGVAIANTNITPSLTGEYASISVVWRKAAGGGGGTTLVVADSATSQTTDAATLTQQHSLVVADSAQGQTTDAAPLTQQHSLVVADSATSQTTDATTVSVTTTLVVADTAQSQTADAAVLSQKHNLTVADSATSQTTDAATLTQQHSLVVADTAQSQTTDTAPLTQKHNLTAADTAQSQTTDAATLTQQHALTVADSASSQTTDAAVLTQKHNLVAADSAQGQTADGLTLTQQHALVVADTAQSQTTDSVALTQVHSLVVADSVQAQTADVVVLATQGTLGINDTAQGQTTDAVALTQVHNLTVADTGQGQTSDAATLQSSSTLAVNDTAQGQTADTPALTQLHFLVLVDTAQGQVSDHVTLALPGELIVADTSQGQTTDAATLTQRHTLVVGDSAQSQTMDALGAITQVHFLVLADTGQGQTADAVTLTQLHVLVPADSAQGQTSDVVVWSAAVILGDMDGEWVSFSGAGWVEASTVGHWVRGATVGEWVSV